MIRWSSSRRIPTMAAQPKLNVQAFPRPPRLEPTTRHLQIRWQGQVIADTANTADTVYWVLETHHPPTYYLPPSAVSVALTRTARSSFCEWKGRATYYAATAPDGTGGTGGTGGTAVVADRIWSYDDPTPGFAPLRRCLSFYAGPWDCYVDGERVEPQPGDFYGGWVTSDIEGIVKGRHGNWDPVV